MSKNHFHTGVFAGICLIKPVRIQKPEPYIFPHDSDHINSNLGFPRYLNCYLWITLRKPPFLFLMIHTLVGNVHQKMIILSVGRVECGS